MTKREASRETLERLAEACDAWYGMETTEQQPGWCDESKEMFRSLSAYRAEITPPLRTRAEVDAEIADTVRRNGPLPHTQHGAVWEIRGVFPERLMKLCAEPPAPEGETSLEMARPGPLMNNAGVRATTAELRVRELEALLADKAFVLEQYAKQKDRLDGALALIRRLCDDGGDMADELAAFLETP